jgi:1-phosphofructokinase
MIATITINPALDRVFYIDDFTINKLHRITDETKELISPGGKGVNISVMLKRFGITTIAMGFTGSIFGKKLEQDLRELGITTNFIRTEEDTRTDIFVIDNKNDTLTEINESGNHISDEDLPLFMDRYKKVLNQIQTIIIAGSLLPLMDPHFYADLVRLAKKKGIKAIVHTAPKYLDAAIKEQPFMIFPDMRSTKEFRGRVLDTVDCCLESGKAIIEKHEETQVVLFSHLVENIVVVTRTAAYVFNKKDKHTANLLGFSDAIVAGVAYGLEQNISIKEALCLGCSAGFKTIEKNEKYCTNLEKVKENVANLNIKELTL